MDIVCMMRDHNGKYITTTPSTSPITTSNIKISNNWW